MAIGEFGGAPAAAVGHGPMLAGPFYWFYEMSQASLNPSRALADATRLFFKNPANPWAHTEYGKDHGCGLRTVRTLDPPLRQAGVADRLTPWSAASASQFTSRRSGNGRSASCCISARLRAPARAGRKPRLLIVAPLSGHYATLLRRHRGRLLALSRRLYHRLGRRPAMVMPLASAQTTISTTTSTT